MNEKEGKARLLLAANLEHAYITGFFTFENLVSHIGKALVPGLVTLTKLHGRNIISTFYQHWKGTKEDNVLLFEKAFVGMSPFYEVMLQKIDQDKVPEVLEHLIESRVITWDNIVAAFPYRSLLACLRESLQRAEEAVLPADTNKTTEEEEEEEEEVEISHPGEGS